MWQERHTPRALPREPDIVNFAAMAPPHAAQASGSSSSRVVESCCLSVFML